MKHFLFYVMAGHGHLRAAEALKLELDERESTDDVRLIDALSFSPKFVHRTYEQSYFLMVRYAPWLWKFFYYWTDSVLPKGFVALVRHIVNTTQARGLERFLIAENPDTIITTHFLPTEVSSRLKRQGRIQSKIVVVVTDFLG